MWLLAKVKYSIMAILSPFFLKNANSRFIYRKCKEFCDLIPEPMYIAISFVKKKSHSCDYV